MFTERARRELPLASVVASLGRAHAAGELTDAELRWALARLPGRGRDEAFDATDRGQRRAEIVTVAARVFRREGYHHATLEAVAKDLNLTKAGVYHYFGSKREILEAICEAAVGASHRVLSEALALPGSPVERMRAAATAYASLVLADDGMLIFIRHFDELSELKRAQVRNTRKVISAALREVLREGAETGELHVPDPGVAVNAFFGSVNWIYSWYERGGRLAPDEVRERLVRQVMDGVLARADG